MAEPLWQAKIAQEVEHPGVLRQHLGGQRLHAPHTGCLDEALGQSQTESVPLPVVGDDGGVLGGSRPRFAVEPDDADDFVRRVRVESDEGEALLAVDMREVPRHGLA